MRNVKQSPEFAGSQMFFYDSEGIIQGHLPPGKINHVASMALMPAMERGFIYRYTHFGLLLLLEGIMSWKRS
jgi:hypothetical protein